MRDLPQQVCRRTLDRARGASAVASGATAVTQPRPNSASPVRARECCGATRTTVQTMSPLPKSMSRTAVDKLGKRLAASDTASDDDLDLLLELLSAYQEVLDVTQARLRALGYQPTSRTKTTGVLIDKLRREHSSLKSVQDIAGTRIICEDRDEQDEIVGEVVRASPTVPAGPR